MMIKIGDALPLSHSKHHIDLSKREAIFKAQAAKELQEIQQKFASQASLWSGDQPLSFTFKDWDPNKQKNVQAAKDIGNQVYKLAKAELLALQYPKDQWRPFNVLFSGAPGVGKTSLALAMSQVLVDKGFTRCVVNTSELSNLVLKRIASAGSYGKQAEINKRLAYTESEMKLADVLLLDDFGTEGTFGRELHQVGSTIQGIIYRVSNARLELKNNQILKPTLITTNNTQNQLEQIYDPKTISRLIPTDSKYRVAFNGFKDARKLS